MCASSSNKLTPGPPEFQREEIRDSIQPNHQHCFHPPVFPGNQVALWNNSASLGFYLLWLFLSGSLFFSWYKNYSQERVTGLPPAIQQSRMPESEWEPAVTSPQAKPKTGHLVSQVSFLLSGDPRSSGYPSKGSIWSSQNAFYLIVFHLN